MTAIQLLADGCARNLEMLKMTIADFTDQELLQRPVPGANNALWQVGHLLAAELSMVNAMKPGTISPLPDGLAQRFGKETATTDNLAALASKAQLLEHFEKARRQTVAWIATLTDADLSQPAPASLRPIFPTVGHVVLLILQHVAMHIGQIQVLRRKLGKPVLF